MLHKLLHFFMRLLSYRKFFCEPQKIGCGCHSIALPYHNSHIPDITEQSPECLPSCLQINPEMNKRQQVEVQLQENEEKYRILFEQATDAIFVVLLNQTGLTGQFIEVNSIACQLLGYTREELLLLYPFDVDIDLQANIQPKFSRNSPTGQHIFETTLLTKYGATIPVEMSNHRFMLHDHLVSLTIARDISVRKQMEQELARLDRLNMVGQMAVNIGHEIRNPLTTVRGFLQLLSRKNEHQQNAEYFSLMLGEIDKANTIITKFLSLAKNKAVTLELANLNDIIRVLHPLLIAHAKIDNKTITLNLADVPDIFLDKAEIRQLIINLVQNGLESMPSSGQVNIKSFVEDMTVVLAIEDSGNGIPQNILEKLGTPFLTTKDQGVGLGLAICYSIVNRHNATIEPITHCTGTTFFIRFNKPT